MHLGSMHSWKEEEMPGWKGTSLPGPVWLEAGLEAAPGQAETSSAAELGLTAQEAESCDLRWTGRPKPGVPPQ